MTDMESLDRAVEEAREHVWLLMGCDYDAGCHPSRGLGEERVLTCGCEKDLDALIEVVSAKARAEERERLVTAMVMAGRLVDEASLVIETALLPTDEPARSSEAGNGS